MYHIKNIVWYSMMRIHWIDISFLKVKSNSLAAIVNFKIQEFKLLLFHPMILLVVPFLIVFPSEATKFLVFNTLTTSSSYISWLSIIICNISENECIFLEKTAPNLILGPFGYIWPNFGPGYFFSKIGLLPFCTLIRVQLHTKK